MNQMHETNREFWDNTLAQTFQDKSEASGSWRNCITEPDSAFDCDVLPVIDECVGDLKGKNICIVGSGDNYSAFAFAGLGANITSVDQSQKQLDLAARRADELGLSINFIQSDAADLNHLPESHFDMVCSTNGFFVWISDLPQLYNGLHRILKPQGHYIFFDIHPFQRPWKDDQLEMEKSYYETGPFQNDSKTSFFFHWTMGDILNALADAGFKLSRMKELPNKDSSFWQDGKWYKPGDDESLLDWRFNPLAGLPVWLLVAAQKS